MKLEETSLFIEQDVDKLVKRFGNRISTIFEKCSPTESDVQGNGAGSDRANDLPLQFQMIFCYFCRSKQLSRVRGKVRQEGSIVTAYGR